MKVVGLISGGKDSCYNLIQCIAAGHTIEALANLAPKYVDELDSYMYQSVGHMGIALYADAMKLPLYRREIEGTSLNTKSLHYVQTEGDEVEDLYYLLKKVKEESGIEAVSVGAVFSDYQRIRVENVCQRLGLMSLSYMWRRDQSELLSEMIQCDLDAILIKVAAIGLIPSKHLGKSIKEMKPYLEKLNEKYSLNVCGEGGEYETFTLNCPLFKKKIVIEETDLVETPGDVGYLNFKSLKLVDKDSKEINRSNKELVDSLQIKSPEDYLQGILLQEEENQPIGLDIQTSIEIFNEEKLCDDNVNHSVGLFWTSVNSTSVREAFDDVTKILNEKGYDLEDIVCIKLFVNSMSNYAQYNKQYNEYFSLNPPTRICVEIPLDDSYAISMDVAAWNNGGRSKFSDNASLSEDLTRHTLHVQSISHWAPANIGPYSQAVKIGDVILVAGMIGLVPGTLEVCKGGVSIQSRLAFRHIGRVLEAMSPSANIKSIVQGVCYVTKVEDISVAKRLMTELSKSLISTYIVVPALPKGAQIEWQTWAHLSNERFLYEKNSHSIQEINIDLQERFSCDKSVYALIATASCEYPKNINRESLEEIVLFCLRNTDLSCDTNSSLNLTLYYKASTVPTTLVTESVKVCPYNVSACAVPVSAVEDQRTFLSVVIVKV